MTKNLQLFYDGVTKSVNNYQVIQVMNEVNGYWAAILDRLQRIQIVHKERILSGNNWSIFDKG